MKLSLGKSLVAFVLCIPFTVQAEERIFVEIDPLAYALNGYSLHGGVEMDEFRFQIGVFGLDIPEMASNNANYKIRQTGYGFKIDYFGERSDGAFIGIEYGATEAAYKLASANFTENRPANLAGIRVGYKYINDYGFYVMPWVGIDKNLSDITPVNPTGERYNVSEYLIFPTVHIGVQF